VNFRTFEKLKKVILKVLQILIYYTNTEKSTGC